MQRGVAKGLKVPCLFMITEVSIRCQKNTEVGIRRIPAYTPQYTTGYSSTYLTRGSQLHGFCSTLYKHRQLCTLCMNDNITKAHRHACNQPTKHTHNRVMAFYLGLTG